MSSFSWSSDLEGWARAFELVAVNLVRIEQKLEDTNQAELFRTAFCLHEAVAATRARGLLVDSEVILRAVARARTPGDGAATWTGVGLYTQARLLSAIDPDEALSPRGVEAAIERAADPHYGARTATDPRARGIAASDLVATGLSPHGPAAGKKSILDTCLAARRLWQDVATRDRAAASAARLLLAPLFAQAGFRLVFLGAAAGIPEMVRLNEASGSDDAWMRSFVPILARASARTLSMVARLVALRNRWARRLSDRRESSARHRAGALDAVFVQPLLSTKNMMQVKAELERRAAGPDSRPPAMSLRLAQTLMAELEEAGAIRSLGDAAQARLWIATDPTLLGV